MTISKRISCVLFDLDGVLVDACEWHYTSLNRALMDVTGLQISRADHEVRFNGLPTKVKLEMLSVKEKDFDLIWRLKQKYTLDEIARSSAVRPEKIELLSFLKAQGAKIACVTNSIRLTAEQMLRSAGQIEFFDRIVTNEDTEKNKPFPDCYDYAIRELQSNPDETLCVEDSEKGIAAAKSSLAKYTWEVANFEDVNLQNYLEFIK